MASENRDDEDDVKSNKRSHSDFAEQDGSGKATTTDRLLDLASGFVVANDSTRQLVRR